MPCGAGVPVMGAWFEMGYLPRLFTQSLTAQGTGNASTGTVTVQTLVLFKYCRSRSFLWLHRALGRSC